MISGNDELIPVDCRKNGSEKDIPFDKWFNKTIRILSTCECINLSINLTGSIKTKQWFRNSI